MLCQCSNGTLGCVSTGIGLTAGWVSLLEPASTALRYCNSCFVPKKISSILSKIFDRFLRSFPNFFCWFLQIFLGLQDPRIVGDLCNEHLLIEGTIPAVSEALIVYLNEFLTSVTAAITPNNAHAVIFAGSRRGHVRKILVKNARLGIEYSRVDLMADDLKSTPTSSTETDPFPFAVRSLRLDASQRYLYALTSSQVSAGVQRTHRYVIL